MCVHFLGLSETDMLIFVCHNSLFPFPATVSLASLLNLPFPSYFISLLLYFTQKNMGVSNKRLLPYFTDEPLK